MTEPTPWGAWLAHAALVLGIRPREFWALSVREWRALTRPRAAPALSRAAFERLAARFPDQPPDQS